MSSFISVICPAWQAAATLAESLASVYAQTLPAGEVVVVDDGSTDKTSDIARTAGATVTRRANGGTPSALNAGIAETRGDLIAFIDADDLWPTDKLAMQARLLAANPGLAGVLGLQKCFVSPEVPAEVAARYRLSETPEPAWLTGALLVRRSVLDSVGQFDPRMRAGHAVDWFDRARRLGTVFLVPQQTVLLRRIHPGSLSHRSALSDAGYALMARKAIQRRRAGGTAE
jgi:glycosyltransferase involved in cell wall biosynthesis